MKKLFLQGLTLTALTALSTTLVLGNHQSALLASGSEPATSHSSATPDPSQSFRILDPQTSTKPLTSLLPYAQPDGRLAVVLRLRDIPVITFIGTTEELTALEQGQSLISAESAMGRAQAIAAQLQGWAQDSRFDAKTITVSYDKTSKYYQVKVGDQVLVSLDKSTTLPAPTRKASQNALQMANRLRRLLGEAPPLAALPKSSAQGITDQVFSPSTSKSSANKRIKSGVASWYGPGFHGRRTANGERFNQNALTAAHRSLPFGTRVLVTNLRTGQSIVVRINDRGPFSHGRVIDLSAAAARQIGVHSRGVAPVALDILQ